MHRAATVGVGFIVAPVIISGCGNTGSSDTIKVGNGLSSVPPEFRPACGHPGAHVEVRHVPVTVRHADCDLTGVGLSYKKYGGAYVTIRSGGIGNSSGFTLTVHPGSQDVTVSVQGGPPGNQ